MTARLRRTAATPRERLQFNSGTADLDEIVRPLRAAPDVMNPGPKAWRIYADPAGHPFCLVSVPE